MKRFRFNLEKILELRRYEERKWELKLGEATGKCLSIKRKMKEQDEKRREILAAYRLPVGAGVEQFRVADSYASRLVEENKKLSEDLKDCEKERDEIKEKFLEASRKRKVIERLKERQQEQYYRRQRKEEQKELDDIAAGRWNMTVWESRSGT